MIWVWPRAQLSQQLSEHLRQRVLALINLRCAAVDVAGNSGADSGADVSASPFSVLIADTV